MSGSLSDAEIEASRWIARLEADDVSLSDHQRFRAWLAKSPANRAAYEGVARSWDKLDALAYLDAPPASALALASAPASAPVMSRRVLLLGGAGAAAVAAVAVVVVAPLMTEDANATPYATDVGERASFQLADGSTAELNAGSELRVTMSARERRAHLTRGEVLFEVAHDEARPFVVKTAFGELRAPDASFLVKVGTQSARITVLNGSVEAAPKAGPSSAPRALSANQEIVLGASTAEATPIATDAMTRRLAWRNGMLAFDGDTLADAALEVERQTGVHFEFADREVAGLRIGGYINATDVGAFTQLIKTNLQLKVEQRSARTVRVSRR